ncbi:T9SS type A sorting domain-containing protein [Crocinitomix catalasitica]|nr:T9SS type A sorting domain-containing protein [Crocinitomix catalasitica]
MKIGYLILIVFTLIFGFRTGFGQSCAGCTFTITTAWDFPYTVTSGQTLCISPSGSLTELLTIMPGGTVCNEGTISTSLITINGGSLSNYGTIVGDVFSVSGGTVNNYNDMTMNEINIAGSDLVMTNDGTLNTGIIDMGYSGFGTNPIFNNNGPLIVNDLITGSNCDINNSSYFDIVYDAIIGANSNVITSESMSIGGNLINNGNFTTFCIIPVGNDLLNTGSIFGSPGSGCGGFSVATDTQNNGSVGMDDSYVDICDAQGPVGGWDLNTGVIGSNVDYCVCTNNCISSTTALTEVDGIDYTLYPNPFIDHTIIDLGYTAGTHRVTIYNVQGVLVKEVNGSNIQKIRIERGDLPAGMYFFQLAIEGAAQSTGRMSIL